MMSEAHPNIDKNPNQTLSSSSIEESIQIESRETGQVTRDEGKNELMSCLNLRKEKSGAVKEEEKDGEASTGVYMDKDEHGCEKTIPETNSSQSAKGSKSQTAMVNLAKKFPETGLQSAASSVSLSKHRDVVLDTGKTKMTASNRGCWKKTMKTTQPEIPYSSNKPEKSVEEKKSSKQYLYEVCSNNFTSAVTLAICKRASCKDSVLNKIVCDVCKEEFTSSKGLKAHEKIHSETKEKPPFFCEGCHKEFSIVPALARHTNVHSLKCDFCSKTFTQKGHLTMHKKVHVGTQTAHRCEHCDQTFMQRSHLLIHLRIHTGENPFTCHVCDRAFKQRGNLTVHMSRHDLNQPRFTCNICGKKFYQRSHFNIHVRIHDGDYPFTCQVCGKGFKQRGNLNVHLRTHRPKSEEKGPKKGRKKSLCKVSSDGVKLERTCSLTEANLPSVDQYSYSNQNYRVTSSDTSSVSNGNVPSIAENSGLHAPDMAVMKSESSMEVNVADCEKNSDTRTVFIIPVHYQSALVQNVVNKDLIDDCIVHDIGSVSTGNDININSTENAQDTNLSENMVDNQATITTFKQTLPNSTQRPGDLGLLENHVDTPALIMEDDYNIFLSTHTELAVVVEVTSQNQFQTSEISSEPEESKNQPVT